MRRGELGLRFILQHEARTSQWKGKLMTIVRRSLLCVEQLANIISIVCKELGGGGQESVCSANAKGLLDW